MSDSTQQPSGQKIHDEQAQQRIDELEMRVVYMEDTIETLNQQLVALTQEFTLAKQAMQLLNRRFEQMQSNNGLIKDISEETPPPHY
ncbi:SlyX family protein [Thalassolituus sp. LLYu03]|uniref:SlyX family protein n=1 Tax=Thalassolituus sp. LLYu03 TaxID=3421656 RepID=UPI003D2A46CC